MTTSPYILFYRRTLKGHILGTTCSLAGDCQKSVGRKGGRP